MPEYIKADADGTYSVPGRRGNFLVKAGGRLPKNAIFVPKGTRAAAEPPVDNETGEVRPLKTEDHPKWYLSYREKATKDGGEAHAMYEGETENAFYERIAAIEEGGSGEESGETGPSETTGTDAQTGPTETT